MCGVLEAEVVEKAFKPNAPNTISLPKTVI